jgi:hypothetical protein
MHDQAFHILGIPPTEDGRAIRAAFVRLARIYHPDRFVGQPSDVREEAERRMKEATTAYETLRDATRGTRVAGIESITEAELQARAQRFRDVMEARRQEEERNRARWRRWDEIEREARERQAVDARIEAMIRDGVEPQPWPQRSADDKPEQEPSKRNGSLLAERLDSARRGETAPLARRDVV